VVGVVVGVAACGCAGIPGSTRTRRHSARRVNIELPRTVYSAEGGEF
jgi:hypothetical protein